MIYTEEQKRIFGENIWIRRQILGMSKEDLAKAYGCGTATVNCWERGANVVPRGRLKDLTRILKCSIHDLHRKYRMPKINFIEAGKIIEKKEEVIMSDEDIIKAATEVFENATYNSAKEPNNVEPDVETSDEAMYGHPVVDRVNKYLTDNHMSQSELSRRIPMPHSNLNRVVHGTLSFDNPNYTKVEEYLDSVENNKVESSIDEPKKMCKPEVKTIKIVEKQTVVEQKEQKIEEKASISSRMSSIYDTLFNALDEMDKLKADIEKIEKVTAMLKEIQGL